MCRNWLGFESHEFDDYLIHWTDEPKEFIKIKESLDKIPKEFHPYVKVLLEKTRDVAFLDKSDEDAGEGL